MSRSTGTDPDRREGLWWPDVGPNDTQPIPVVTWDDEPTVTEPGLPPTGVSGFGRHRGGRRLRSLLLELVLAAGVSIAVAAAMGWQVLGDLRRTIPGTGPDPYLELWALAWSGHALKPGSGVSISRLFDGNAFYPADYSLAFTDSLLGYGPITWFFSGTTGLVTAYNVIFVFGPALSSLGAYALARQLGAHPVGAAVAGAGFAYAPWHFGQFADLHVLSTGPMVLALAMLARGHGLRLTGRWAPTRPIWALLGWLFGAWQLTIGFAHGLPFGYLLALIGGLTLLMTPLRRLTAGRRERVAEQIDRGSPVHVITPHPSIRRLVQADLIGVVVFAAVAAVMAYPYLRVKAIDPQAVEAARGLDQVLQNSPQPVDLITPPAVAGTWSWLTSGQSLVSGTNQVGLLPGAILIALAVLGLLVSNWRWQWRLTLLVAGVLLTALCLGSRLPDQFFPGPDSPFVLLWQHLPGWSGSRTPGRLIVFGTLVLALLAAGAVSRLSGWGQLGSRNRGRAPRLRAVVLLVLPVLILLEGWARIPLGPVPAPPEALSQAVGPIVVLPSERTNDSKVMFWTAVGGFPEVGNGQSGITPTTLTQMRSELAGFPNQRSVAYLRRNGFRSVVVLPSPLATALRQDGDQALDPGLGLTRQDLGESLLYRLAQ